MSATDTPTHTHTHTTHIIPLQVILVSTDGLVLEGGSSNVFIEKGGVLYTADEGILKGTIRNLCIEAAHGSVELHPLNVETHADWTGMLITSTSRLALPVHEVVIPSVFNTTAAASTLTFSKDEKSLVSTVAKRVKEEVLFSHSEAMFTFD